LMKTDSPYFGERRLRVLPVFRANWEPELAPHLGFWLSNY
jgi:hypothetical protein